MLSLRALKAARVLFLDKNAVKLYCRHVSGISRTQTAENCAEAHEKGSSSFLQNTRLRTLAIETSCDDTSVAVLSISRIGDKVLRTDILFHDKIVAKSEAYHGIHPLVALDSHQTELGILVQGAIAHLKANINSNESSTDSGYESDDRPDFVTVTRGPGMRSNLSVGLDTAKGLALAWRVPLLGVHHMQAHALTPRLCSTINAGAGTGQSLQRYDELGKSFWQPKDLHPRFPFLSVLASGGHTMLIDSQSLTEHEVLAETADIALGDCLDKAARAILLDSELSMPYGKALEDFAFPLDQPYSYAPPMRRQQELERRITQWGWSIKPPFAESRSMTYSFSGLLTFVQRLINDAKQRPLAERREVAQELQRIAFEHLCSRILLHLSSLSNVRQQQISAIVVSGGVASNRFLRHVLRSMLDVRGFKHIEVCFPPVELCTDNALMIAWAGMEMWDAGYESELTIRPIRKWSMDSKSEDGGILGVGGWKRRLESVRG